MVCYNYNYRVLENIYNIDCCFVCKKTKECIKLQKDLLQEGETVYCKNCSSLFDCSECLNYEECYNNKKLTADIVGNLKKL